MNTRPVNNACCAAVERALRPGLDRVAPGERRVGTSMPWRADADMPWGALDALSRGKTFGNRAQGFIVRQGAGSDVSQVLGRELGKKLAAAVRNSPELQNARAVREPYINISTDLSNFRYVCTCTIEYWPKRYNEES